VQVSRKDARAPMGRCRAYGDPHLVTFDGLSYDIYTTGNFIYARNLAYVPVEVIFPRAGLTILGGPIPT